MNIFNEIDDLISCPDDDDCIKNIECDLCGNSTENTKIISWLNRDGVVYICIKCMKRIIKDHKDKKIHTIGLKRYYNKIKSKMEDIFF